MWLHVAQSLQGPSHAADNSPCQDSHAVSVLGEGESESIVACAADGAGSAKHSDIGSHLACQTIQEKAASFFQAHGNFNSLSLDEIHKWCDSILENFQLKAQEGGYKTKELATTLCVAIISPTASFFFQIGDGAITVGHNGLYGVVFWPQSGEYANTTNFVTSENYKNHLEFQATTSKITEIAIFTDGIERLALNFEARTPHLPFFQPLFTAIRSSQKGQNLAGDLGNFLQSDSVNKRSDDDKTLILATQLTEATDAAS